MMKELNLVAMKDVIKVYQIGRTKLTALNGITLEVLKNDFLVLMGPSGSGKTSILNLIGLIDYPTSGSLMVLGRDVRELSERELCRMRLEKLGFVFQNFSLLEVLTVEENIAYPLMLKRVPKKIREKMVGEILEFFGLAGYQKRRPNILSGGERQRVAIARALITNPEIIIADEFTANLDTRTSLEIIKLMKEYHRNHQTTFIIATHDPLVKDFAKKIIYLKDGMIQKVEQIG
ncbi:MAG: ABC transporter ATP-binding protein [bacterium]